MSLLSNADRLLTDGKYGEALAEYSKLPRNLKRSAEVQIRLGGCRFALGQIRQAIRGLRAALSLHHAHNDLSALLARCYREAGWFEKCRTLAREVLARDPQCFEALRCAFLSSFDLRDVETAIAYSRDLTGMRDTVEHRSLYLYMLLFSSLPPREQAAEHVRICQPAETRITPRLSGTGRIKIAYVSAMFGVHTECFEPAFRFHDRTKFEVHAFADRGKYFAVAETTLAPLCDAWHETTALSNEELDRHIRELGIDALVDCDGHFYRGQRLPLYGMRPARMQVSFLYPGFTGVAGLDYRIADEHLTGGDRWLEHETPIAMPVFACRLPLSEAPNVGPLPAVRNGYITFGAFAPPMKINAPIVALWARILRAVPRSRLLLHGKMGAVNRSPFRDVRDRLTGEFESHGVNPKRLLFRSNLPFSDHLKMYDFVDMILDPFPHNGMRTTMLALYMGVPVLSLVGECTVSRMGLSLLTASRLPDWVAHTPDEYVRLAVTKAEDVQTLALLRSGLRGQVERSPVMDGEGWTRSFEAAVQQVLERQAR